MKIAVCVKHVPEGTKRIDPSTKRLDRSGEGALKTTLSVDYAFSRIGANPVGMRPLLPRRVSAVAGVLHGVRCWPQTPIRKDGEHSHTPAAVIGHEYCAVPAIDRNVARISAAGRSRGLHSQAACRGIAPKRRDRTALAAVRLRIVLIFIHRIQHVLARRHS